MHHTLESQTPRFDALKKELRRLVAPSEVVLVGSAPLAQHHLRDVADLDVLVEAGAYARISKHFPEDWKVDYDSERDIYGAKTQAGMIQLSLHAEPFVGTVGLVAWDIVKAAHQSSRSEGDWLVMSLEQALKVKKARGQEKDQEDVRLIDAMFDHRALERGRCR